MIIPLLNSLPWTWVDYTSLCVWLLHWDNSYDLSPFLPPSPISPSLNHTAQHALLEDIESLRPLGSTSSTGIRVFVTVFSSWRSVFYISSTLNFYVWFNASGFTHINCLKGWNHIWNENSRMKNSDCWMGLDFSATERKLYGLIFTTL